ncbi:vgr related protein [Novosphingobium sp. Chol11]|uniref:vgr related protein n=1 Tax=Novosphingobium sp. Chol11 TaxID=1385763 RepID=UPI0025ED0B9F|nr:vgr related protein [Novosphingobium sp. Chol11]
MSDAGRPLTPGEGALVREVFRNAIDLAPVRIRLARFFPFQPTATVMAPMGHIHFHPKGPHYRDDFAEATVALQGLFIHEMVHVWQSQQKGRFWLPLMRHPFCRYDYRFVPGKPFEAYGIEQQAELVRHAFLAMRQCPAAAAPPLETLSALLPF